MDFKRGDKVLVLWRDQWVSATVLRMGTHSFRYALVVFKDPGGKWRKRAIAPGRYKSAPKRDYPKGHDLEYTREYCYNKVEGSARCAHCVRHRRGAYCSRYRAYKDTKPERIAKRRGKRSGTIAAQIKAQRDLEYYEPDKAKKMYKRS